MPTTETKQRRQPAEPRSDQAAEILNAETIGRNNAPVHEVRLGRVVAAIWPYETDYGMRYNVTLSRIYKDGTDWKRSDSFGRDDLPLVSKVADRAHDWIFEQGRSRVQADEAA